VTATSAYDFDLHGIAGIRLVDASPADQATVTAQLGPMHGPLRREPDIVIRFVDRLDLPADVRLLGNGEAAFTNDTFLILQSKHRTPARVQVPFDRVGDRLCTIVCERGLAAVPLLLPILNLTVLARGGLAVHASAFRYHDTGVLVTGWSRGGKTETLLAFTTQGAEYIGDEWIYLDGAGDRAFGIPEPIRVWDWHLTQLPACWARLGLRRRLRLRSLRAASAALHAFGAAGGRHVAGSWLYRAAGLVDRQRYARLRPHETFRGGSGSIGGLSAPIDRVLFVASYALPTTSVEPVDARIVADRMAFSLQEERAPFLSFYRKFRFAFPGRPNPHIDNADVLEHARLRRVLSNRDCFAVYHPYPPSIPALFYAIRSLIESGAPRSSPEP
jgi:hypothetical protein